MDSWHRRPCRESVCADCAVYALAQARDAQEHAAQKRFWARMTRATLCGLPARQPVPWYAMVRARGGPAAHGYCALPLAQTARVAGGTLAAKPPKHRAPLKLLLLPFAYGLGKQSSGPTPTLRYGRSSYHQELLSYQYRNRRAFGGWYTDGYTSSRFYLQNVLAAPVAGHLEGPESSQACCSSTPQGFCLLS